MRWLADENLPMSGVRYLRERGQDVLAIVECQPGITDDAVIAMAAADRRALITFDRDHGDLIYRGEATPPLAVIYLRIHPHSPEALNELLGRVISLGDEALNGHFTVVSDRRIRQRPLPVKE